MGLRLSAQLYDFRKTVKRTLNGVLDRYAPGWGLRKHFKILDAFMRRTLETPAAKPNFEAMRLRPNRDMIAAVRFGSIRLKLYLNPNDSLQLGFLNHELLLHHVWEPNISRLLSDAVNPGSVVLDIGANIGYYSILAAKLVGSSGKVVAFEPDPTNYKFLCRNIALNGLGGGSRACQ